jgi:hypothetical protein
MDLMNVHSANENASLRRHQMAPHFQGSSTRSEDEELARRYEKQIMRSAKKEQIASTLLTRLAGFIGRPADAGLLLELSAEARCLLGTVLGEEFEGKVEGEDGQFNVTIGVK